MRKINYCEYKKAAEGMTKEQQQKLFLYVLEHNYIQNRLQNISLKDFKKLKKW